MAFPRAGKGSLELGRLLGEPPAWAAASSWAAVPIRRAAPSATQITVVLPHSSRELLYLGTESGTVFVVQVPAFRTLEDKTVSSDAVLQR